jgi:hypothetical protein
LIKLAFGLPGRFLVPISYLFHQLVEKGIEFCCCFPIDLLVQVIFGRMVAFPIPLPVNALAFAARLKPEDKIDRWDSRLNKRPMV